MHLRPCLARLQPLVLGLVFLFLAGIAGGAAADIPKELYEGIGVRSDASPKLLYEALVKRYRDPAQGAGKGKYADLWQPIPFSKYFDPHSFYAPPSTVSEVAGRADCVECHLKETPGWVHQWKQSAHANLGRIRALEPSDVRFYQKAKLEEVERNLRSLGKLGANEALREVGCIDCHVDVNLARKADHRKDLRMPTAEVCAACHLSEFAERESERDTAVWPKGVERTKGRPSHALDYQDNVETGIWAGMPQREIAEGCTACHMNQNKCDTCHTRHSFSLVEARKPEACGTCHSGIDHNNIENYLSSKHGVNYLTLGSSWNWNVPLKDGLTKGGQTAPTCQTCHMEFNGKYGHNVVRKVRWANYPMVPGIAEAVVDSDWSRQRLGAWVKTCTQCHSERFARAYLELMDKATLQGVQKVKEAQAVVQKLYDDGLLPGQKTNRPAPPAPEKDAPMEFFQLMWSKGNNPTAVELEGKVLAENLLPKLFVGVAHVNPGGWTYTESWEQINAGYSRIMDYDTQLRERAAAAKPRSTSSLPERTLLALFAPQRDERDLWAAGFGGAMLLGGVALLWRSRRGRRDV